MGCNVILLGCAFHGIADKKDFEPFWRLVADLFGDLPCVSFIVAEPFDHVSELARASTPHFRWFLLQDAEDMSLLRNRPHSFSLGLLVSTWPSDPAS